MSKYKGKMPLSMQSMMLKKKKEMGIQVRMKPWVYDSAPPELSKFKREIARAKELLRKDPIPLRWTERERAMKEKQAFLEYKRKREAFLARRFNWGACLYESFCCFKSKPSDAYYEYQKWPTEGDIKKQNELKAPRKHKGKGTISKEVPHATDIDAIGVDSIDAEAKKCEVSVCTCAKDGEKRTSKMVQTCDVSVGTCARHFKLSTLKKPEDSRIVCKCPPKPGKSKKKIVIGDDATAGGEEDADTCICSPSSSIEGKGQQENLIISEKPSSQSVNLMSVSTNKGEHESSGVLATLQDTTPATSEVANSQDTTSATNEIANPQDTTPATNEIANPQYTEETTQFNVPPSFLRPDDKCACPRETDDGSRSKSWRSGPSSNYEDRHGCRCKGYPKTNIPKTTLLEERLLHAIPVSCKCDSNDK